MQKIINKRSKLDYIAFLLLPVIFIGCTSQGPPKSIPNTVPVKIITPALDLPNRAYQRKQTRFWKDSFLSYYTDSIFFKNYSIVLHHFCDVSNYDGKEYVYDDFNLLEVLQNGKRVYLMDSAALEMRIDFFRSYKTRKINEDTDISSNRNMDQSINIFEVWNSGNIEQLEFDTIVSFKYNDPPKLILWGDTKGMHCCKQLFIYELGEQFREIALIETAHLDFDKENRSLMLNDMDNDSIPEITFYDPSWRYWNNTAGFEAPYFKTILKYSNGEYHLYKEKMFKPLPSKQKYDEMVRRCQKLGESVNNTSTLWSYMLELIYSGHFNKAIEFLNEAWPEEIEGKEKFFSDFMDNLYYFQYGKELIEWQ